MGCFRARAWFCEAHAAYDRRMKTMFWFWMGVVALGLVAMLAIVLMGR